MDIHDRLDTDNAAYFRKSREARYGKTLEQVSVDREAGLAAFRASLEPLRSMLAYQPYIGGQTPLFADYIVFSAFQWMRIMSPFQVLVDGDVVTEWFERCLDLHGTLGRKVSAVA
jgi:glutathione S-transferase